jgi:hypothetical protein
MAIQVFNLRSVPDDEAEDLRRLLESNGVDFYETPAGRWGMSAPALWIKDDAQRERVLGLIANYQKERASRAREEYRALKAEGRHLTLWDSFKRHPVRSIAALLAVAFVVYVSVGPFLRMVAK